jgi:hypothetical protein
MDLYLKDLPIIKKKIRKIDDHFKIFGLVETARKIVYKASCKIVVNKDISVDNILQNGSCVIIVNTPNKTEAIPLVSSLFNRKDIYIIANYIFLNIFTYLDKHIIPVYIHHHYGKKNNHNLLTFFYSHIFPIELYSQEESHQKNIKSISDACNKLDNGGIILIAPGQDKSNNWFPGVGYLLKGVKHNNQVFVIFTYIHGTSILDILRIMPIVNKLLPPVTIIYHEPIKVDALIDKEPKEIVRHLQASYYHWVDNISN